VFSVWSCTLTHVARGRRECFYLEVGKEETGEVTVQVSVIKGGLLDILIDVFDPHDNKLFSRMFFEGKGDSDIKFTAEVRPRRPAPCFFVVLTRRGPTATGGLSGVLQQRDGALDGQGERAVTPRACASDTGVGQVVAMKMFVSKHAKPSSPGDSQPVTPADVDPLEARLDALANTLSLVSSEQVRRCICFLFVSHVP
jgi:hypothetical protein